MAAARTRWRRQTASVFGRDIAFVLLAVWLAYTTWLLPVPYTYSVTSPAPL